MKPKKISMDQIAAMNMVYQRYSFEYFLDSLDRLGISHFELWAGAPHFSHFVPSLADAGRLRRQVEGREKKIVCVTPEQCLYPHNIAAADKGLRDFSLDYFLKYIDMTAELGADKMLCCAGWGNFDDPFEEAWKRSAESLRVLCERARRAGIVLAFEVLCPGESNLVNDFASVKRMMDEIRVPEFQLCIDTVPIRLSGSTVEEFFEEFGPRICHVHITDGHPTGHIPTGLGEHPIGHYIRVLGQNGYDGYATLEIGNGEWYSKPEEATELSFSTLRNIIELEGKTMIIDAHFQPIFFKEVCPTEELAQSRKNMMAYYKAGRQDMRRIIEVNKINGVDKAILMPFDYSTKYGDLIANDEVKKLVDQSGGAFYGFASIDPDREDALPELEHAFRDLGLSGLKLHPSKQAFYPQDEKMYPIYELCARYNKPITFNAGMSWQPDALSEYSRPIHFERVALEFPKLRICLAHMGFPWVAETAAMLAKYPNMYADTGALYFDSAYEFYEYMFCKAMDVTWLDRGIRHQVMFATNFPRWHAKRTLKALTMLGLREETVELITGKNALEFLGEREVGWIS